MTAPGGPRLRGSTAVTDFTAVDRWIEQHLEASLAELATLVAQPSTMWILPEACARTAWHGSGQSRIFVGAAASS